MRSGAVRTDRGIRGRPDQYQWAPLRPYDAGNWSCVRLVLTPRDTGAVADRSHHRRRWRQQPLRAPCQGAASTCRGSGDQKGNQPMSRGLWFSMNARTRRSLTLLWTALFLFSLALQSVTLATPAAVLGRARRRRLRARRQRDRQRRRRRRLECRVRRRRLRLRDGLHHRPDQRRRRQVLHRWRLQGHLRHPGLAAGRPSASPRTRTTSPMRTPRRTTRERQRSHRLLRPRPLRAQRRRAGRLLVPPGTTPDRSPERRQLLGHATPIGDVLVQIDFENGGASPVAARLRVDGSASTSSRRGGACTAAGADDDRCAVVATPRQQPRLVVRRQGRGGPTTTYPPAALRRGRHQPDRPRPR